MQINDEILKQKQTIARCERDLALEKIKKRKADTRRKIELGGLMIKSGMDGFNKAIIIGSLIHTIQLISQDKSYLRLFESIGEKNFFSTS